VPPPPIAPKIYHIVHMDRLGSIIADGGLWSDRVILGRQIGGTVIGMNSIKQRRLTLPVDCHPGHRVGDFVPFYFCPRSIMLYVIHCANHPELTYRGGQGPIVHLEADLRRTIAWADVSQRRWAFALSNAGAIYTQFRCQLDQIDQVSWPAIAATDFRSAEIKEGKQAEFLIHEFFPWHLVERIGVLTQGIAQQVANATHGIAHKPKIEIQRTWYY
jgi:hypothetical protein